MQKINLADQFAKITKYWDPVIAGELNDQQVKLAKFKGEFTWHKHENEDEFFLVIKGSFSMHFRDRIETLQQGEFLIVPRGVEHKPVAEHEVEVLLFEPATTINTGNVINEFTKTQLKTI